MKNANVIILLMLVTGACIVPVAAEEKGAASFNPDESISVNGTHHVTPTQTTPIPPGMNPWESLRGRHPNVESNAEIMEYIHTCGLSSWYEKHYNTTCRYVYLIPGPACTQKLVYLNRNVNEREDNDSIVWVRLIDLDEELPVEVPDPLAGFYVMYPEARDNPAIKAFVKEYRPERWSEYRVNETSVQVYLVAENRTFRQLIATVEGTSITGVTVLDETDLEVNKTEALARARQQVSPTAEHIDIHLRLKDERVVWFISYMEGPVFTSIKVDAGEVPVSSEKLPGFSLGSALGSLLLLWGIRRKKDGE
ncbi:hypothetical protein E2N92_01425 [Methanofollis formosanus]|uniref:Uncharacterized protein n=1 Tax=Methanofollis formosanus TaxID=299308 RepID=A0A8G0ZWW3_9EURY|nr:hypothetical protein [Methanofollis formosanus]QYZ78184.1 hypothetical protein E2N92_01425 [Methanofollis formosanus]